VVGVELTMADRSVADDVLAHSEDEGEWEDGPALIESRPRGTQVISARLPVALAQQLLDEAGRRGVKPSDLVREAMEGFLSQDALPESVTGFPGHRLHFSRLSMPYATENPVVTDPPDFSNFVALGAQETA